MGQYERVDRQSSEKTIYVNDLPMDNRSTAHNSGFKEIGGSLVYQTFVLLFKFSAGRKFCAPKSPTS